MTECTATPFDEQLLADDDALVAWVAEVADADRETRHRKTAAAETTALLDGLLDEDMQQLVTVLVAQLDEVIVSACCACVRAARGDAP